MGSLYLALLHHPVLDRGGGLVTSSVTSLDLHDLARVGRTYGASALFVVHPSTAQRVFVRRVIEHFVSGPGRDLHPQRGETLEFIDVVPSLEDALMAVEGREGVRPLTAATSARPMPGAVGYDVLRRRLEEAEEPVVLMFGTSWGLAPEVVEGADVRLRPLEAERETGFNHLSVRGAAAIVLDRLLGARDSGPCDGS